MGVKVLVACEESQTVCKAFREKGHEAYSCDLRPCTGGHPEWHIQADVIPLLNGDCTFRTVAGTAVEVAGEWDLIIAHPPCTFLSAAGACRLYPQAGVLNEDRVKKGIMAKDFFMLFLNAKCRRIAIENPVPLGLFSMPKASQTIQPHDFGEGYSKKTCLWLKGLPPLMATEIMADHKPFVSCGTSRNKGNPDKAGASRAGGDAYARSKTFQGIAKAMAEQWG